MKILIERVKLETSTPGSWYLGHDKQFLLCKTLELPWLDNANNISCVPNGDYIMVKEEHSPKHKYPHFRILAVPGRRGILVHWLTYVSDLLGCIGVGSAHKDLNKDGIPDIIDSRITLDKLYKTHPNEIHLLIRDKT